MTTELATVSNSFLAEMAAEAKDVAAKERPKISKLSTKAGQLSLAGMGPIAGNKLDVVVLAAAHRRAWYAGAFNPNDIKNPNCFAFSADGKDMAPHENVSEPVHPTCKGCPKDEWGSAGNGSKGKACKETRRVMLLPAGDAKSVESVQKAESAMLDLPVTSVANYGKYVSVLASFMKRPQWAVATEVRTVPDAKTQFKVEFTPMAAIDDEDVLRALQERSKEAMNIAMTPYDESYKEGEAVPQPTGKKASGKF